jgi:LysM repeat protein
MKSTDWIKLGGCVAFAALLFTGCTSKPKTQDTYTGILSSRGMLPPATVGGAAHHKTVKPATAVATAPKAADDDFVVVEDDNAAPKSEAPVVAPQPETKPEVKAEANKNLPAAPADGRKVPDFGGKNGKSAAGATGTATYVVKRGDIFARIARNHGIKSADLLAMNPSVKDPSKILVGQKLNVPGNGSATTAASTPAVAPKSGAPRENLPADGVYTVVANDSLWTVAKRFGVKRDEIKSWNNLSSDKLRVGQKLKLRADAKLPAGTTAPTAPAKPATPAPAQPVAEPATPVAAPVEAPATTAPEAVEGPVITPAQNAPQEITIDWGIMDENDTLENIASQMGCSVDDLLRLNPNVKSDADLKIGGSIKVPQRVVE